MNFLLPLAMMDEGGFSIIDAVLEASIANQLIIAILLYLLGYQIYIAMERYVTYRDSEEATGKFLKLFMESLKKGDFDAAKKAAMTHNKSHVALVLKHSLDIYQFELTLRAKNPHHNVIESVQRSLERGTAEVTELLKKGLANLATIGALAPFIGLLGTVVGIMRVFSDLKRTGAGDINVLAGSIGEALFATALGLLVAIPAVWVYNLFTGKQEKVVMGIHSASSQMVDEFIRREN